MSLVRNYLIFFSIFIFLNHQLLANELMSFDTNINAPLEVNADKMYIDKIALEGGFSGSVKSIEAEVLFRRPNPISFITGS